MLYHIRAGSHSFICSFDFAKSHLFSFLTYMLRRLAYGFWENKEIVSPEMWFTPSKIGYVSLFMIRFLLNRNHFIRKREKNQEI